MSYCTNCGNKLTDNMLFCPNCGTRVGAPGSAGNRSSYSEFKSDVKKAAKEVDRAFGAADGSNENRNGAPQKMNRPQDGNYGQGLNRGNAGQYGQNPNGRNAGQYGQSPNGRNAGQYGQSPNGRNAGQYGQSPNRGNYDNYGRSNAARNTCDPIRREHLKDDRGLISFILLSIITVGIYCFYVIYRIAHDMNIVCENDEENTTGLVLYIILSLITCGIYNLYWEYKLMNRVQANAPYYGIQITENGTSVLIWEILGYLTCGICKFVAWHIILKNTSRLFKAYNERYGV